MALSLRKKNYHILLVDDEIDTLETLIDLLDSSHYLLDTAENYRQARQKLHARQYDLAIIDIMGVQGFELLEEFAYQLPCIIFTARALSRNELLRSLKHRAARFLPKDHITEISEHVFEVLEVWEKYQSNPSKATQALWKTWIQKISLKNFWGTKWKKEKINFQTTIEDEFKT